MEKKLINRAAELVAMQSLIAPFTVRNGLDVMRADKELLSECVEVFGCTFEALEQGLTELGMIDVEFKPEVMF